MNTESIELNAIGFIHNSLDVKEPLNQLGMPNYYYEKIGYLKSAIKVLETQIKEYEKQASSWEMASSMNNAMEGGKKYRKSRKTKKSKRI